MKAGWTSFALGAVMGGALGFVGGQVAAWPRGTDRQATFVSAASAQSLPLPSSTDAPAGALPDTTDELTVFFPEATPAQAVRAEGFSAHGGSQGQDTIDPAQEPATLPGANDAVPLNVREDQERHNLRRLIDAEMGNISDQDREVWEDVLRGLPAEDALGILRMWQRFGQGAAGDAPGLPTSPSGLSPLVPRDPPAAFVPGIGLARRVDSAAHSGPVRGALLQARSILLNNLLNAHSAGFRRSEPILADLSYDDAKRTVEHGSVERSNSEARAGVQWIGQRLDLTEGTCSPTGGTFDLAIQGDGFFIVRGADRRFYTRCGRFRINADRRLILPTGETEFQLEPEIVIPADAHEVLVDTSGAVSARTSSAVQPVKLGRVSLARFLDPTGLVPVGRCLLTAGPAAGLVRQAAPGDDAGIILQGRLESSNVARDQERERLRQLDELLELLATSAR